MVASRETGGDKGGIMDPNTSSTLMMLALLVIMFILFYFLMIRPQRKRQQEHQSMVTALKPGEGIITIGGIYGQIESLSDDSLVIKVESGALLRISRQAVAYKQSEANPSK
jgi:preprotein translocase subunit YajC